jgi:hypothetical protein
MTQYPQWYEISVSELLKASFVRMNEINRRIIL